MCDSDSVFDPVEVIFDDEPYDVLVDPADEERELPFCDENESISILIRENGVPTNG